MQTYELAISLEDDNLTHARMIPMTGGRYVLAEEARAEIEQLHELISGKAAENPGHPFWKTASREELLELAQFQSATTKEYMKETADLYTENERLRGLLADQQRWLDELHHDGQIKDTERYRRLKQHRKGY